MRGDIVKLWYKTGSVAALSDIPRDRIICFDVETTGLNPQRDEVLQVAFINGEGDTLMACYVRPEHHSCWTSAQRVHGITPAAVESCASVRSLAPKIDTYFRDAELVVGYNVPFDLAFLKHVGISCGNTPVFDVMREAAPVIGRWDYVRKRFAWTSLSQCAQFFGVSFRPHDALEDARATLACFRSMLDMGPKAGRFASRRTYLDVVNRYSVDRECVGGECGE